MAQVGPGLVGLPCADGSRGAAGEEQGGDGVQEDEVPKLHWRWGSPFSLDAFGSRRQPALRPAHHVFPGTIGIRPFHQWDGSKSVRASHSGNPCERRAFPSGLLMLRRAVATPWALGFLMRCRPTESKAGTKLDVAIRDHAPSRDTFGHRRERRVDRLRKRPRRDGYRREPRVGVGRGLFSYSLAASSAAQPAVLPLRQSSEWYPGRSAGVASTARALRHNRRPRIRLRGRERRA